MFSVYILYSFSHNKTYVGFTKDLQRRIYEHNHTQKGFTKKCRPWLLAYVETFVDKYTAIKREKHFKSGVGRAEIKKIVDNFLLIVRYPPPAEKD